MLRLLLSLAMMQPWPTLRLYHAQPIRPGRRRSGVSAAKRAARSKRNRARRK